MSELKDSRPAYFLILSSGWGIRNYLYTGFARGLADKFRLTVFTPHADHPHLLNLARIEGYQLERLDPLQEGVAHKLMRQFRKKFLQSFHRIKTEDILSLGNQRKLYMTLFSPLIKVLSRLPFASRILAGLESVNASLLPPSPYKGLFDREQPQHVFISSPFDVQEWGFAQEAWARGVSVHTLIPSWDNLSTKGCIHSGYQRIFVWSERQKSELLSYYPQVSPERVSVVGVPQFDIYQAPMAAAFERMTFLRSLGIDPAAQVILYSTAPSVLAPNEHEIVRDLRDFIRSRPDKKLHLLVRCHPHDQIDRYTEFANDSQITVTLPSRKNEKDMYAWIPPVEDLWILTATVKCSAVCVNVASTMTLDAAVCNIPAINIAYDGPQELNYERSVRRFYDFTHYAPVVEIGAAPLAHSRQELETLLDRVLENPDELRNERRRLVIDQAGYESGDCVDRLLSFFRS